MTRGFVAGLTTARRRHGGPLVAIARQALAAFALLLATTAGALAAGRTIVLGFDGMEPKLVRQWMADGTLPNFARLAEQGSFQELPTTNPAQSPVAWASFATGLNPGAHGIFDFLARNPKTYTPDYSIAEVVPPQRFLRAFGFQLPLDSGSIINKRIGTPFWIGAEREGQPASVMRVPVTYPPDPITEMLSGMGVPDLLGTQGTFTYYTTAATSGGQTTGGRQVHVAAENGRITTVFEGPPDPFRTEPTPLNLPIVIEDAGGGSVRVTLAGTTVELSKGAWSDWISLRFTFGGFMGVRGLVRLHLVEAFPDLRLYVSPIQIDPRSPAVPISSPDGFAADLATRLGLFHTIGMPEETWSLNENLISDDAWLDMEATILAEVEASFFDALARHERGLLIAVFVQTDRTSHMFWRGIDPLHPLHAETSERGKQAIRWIYGEADRILGKTMAALKPDDRLIVLSDHGFAPYRRSVHLNRWLAENGFMALKPGAPPSESLFGNVNWPRTQAYAMGLNGIFLNLRGREALGIVRPEQVAEIKRAITEKLLEFRDPDSGARVIDEVADAAEIYQGPNMANAPDLVIGYAPGYRASWQTSLGGVPEALVVDNDRRWSGDHLIAPGAVPGVLFTSFPLAEPVGSITEMPKLIRQNLGLLGAVDPAMVRGSRGYLDVAAPVLSAVDGAALGWAPVALRVVLWSAFAAFVSMLVYRYTSAQGKLAAIKAELVGVRQRLQEFDGEFRQLWPILGRNLALSGKQLGLTFVPAMIATVPVLLVLAWMSNAFDARMPSPGETVRATLVPAESRSLPPVEWRGFGTTSEIAPGTWSIAWPAANAPLTMLDSDGTRLLELPLAAPVRTVAQREWWNAIIGNPAGYLPSPGDVAAIELDLPQPTVLPIGPAWLRGWLATAILVLVVVSIFLKIRWRLH